MENTSNGLDFLGRARARAIAKGITSVGNVLLNILLIPLIGVIGAVLATLVTYSIYTSLNVYVMSTELNVRDGQIADELYDVIVVTAAMVVVVVPISRYIEGVITLFATVGIGVVVWGVISIQRGFISIDDIRAAI